MDCHDVRPLLPYFYRAAQELDATDRQDVQGHLDTCPACARLVHAEQALDHALGTVVRAVPVPVEAPARLLVKLADARRPKPWQWVVRGAAAAAVLLSLSLAAYAYFRPMPVDVEAFAQDMKERSRSGFDDVEDWFHHRGLAMKRPPGFDGRFLQSFDVVDFQGRRAPKLVFRRSSDQGPIVAYVVVLDRRFSIPEADHPLVGSSVHVLTNDELTYLVYVTGGPLDSFRLHGGL
jgi:hypothetical protein